MTQGTSRRVVAEKVIRYITERFPGLLRSWFGELQLGDCERGELLIAAPQIEQVIYLRRYCRQAFTEAAQFATGHLVTSRFDQIDGSDADEGPDETDRLRLDGHYRMESFVVGPCNRMAHAA